MSENRVYRRKGPGIENHILATEPVPKAKHGEAVVRIHAVSLNYRDLMLSQGPNKDNIIPLSDGAGEVVEVGEGVTNVKVGDRVTPNFVVKWIAGESKHDHYPTSLAGASHGVAARYITARAETLVHIPAHLTYEEAATLPCAALTAWNALFEGPNVVRPGETVLVEGTGGVSIFALQLATAAGARVFVTSSSNEKLQKAKALGAAGLINYKENPDWDQAARQLTDNKGVDHIIEVGGKDTVPKAVKAVRHAGNIYVIGGVSGFDAGFIAGNIIMSALNIRGILIGSVQMFERMNAAISLHKIKPQIDKVFDFDKLQDALKYLESGAHFGKIVVRVD